MPAENSIHFSNFSYTELPEVFYQHLDAIDFTHTKPVIFNPQLQQQYPALTQYSVDELLQQLLTVTQPLAQAYAGHQFGNFTLLGDGRAMLVAEIDTEHSRFDLQLKGSGRTPYSRGGDGKATLKSMLREYLYSEALVALKIPTSRSLAVLSTGEKIQRQTLEDGAVLIRLAHSHLRVGTFQYAASLDDHDALQQLADYTIARHIPEVQTQPDKYAQLLTEVIKKQAHLIAQWLSVGFIHGVMNTDNMSIAGETIDYGPCAFINHYDPAICFSSIDTQGRYAYGQQHIIAKWNLCRLAESLLPLLAADEDSQMAIAQQAINEFDNYFSQAWYEILHQKLGLLEVTDSSNQLIDQLFEIMYAARLDFHNTFYQLTYTQQDEFDPALETWAQDWHALLATQQQTLAAAKKLMQAINPQAIARNHLVEAALEQASQGDETSFLALLEDLQQPFAAPQSDNNYRQVPAGHDEQHQTYCGT